MYGSWSSRRHGFPHSRRGRRRVPRARWRPTDRSRLFRSASGRSLLRRILPGKSVIADATPAGLDLCTGAPGARILAARDSGQGAYQPYATGDLTLLGIQVPVYRGGVVPTTVAARRAAFIGWVALALLPKVLLETAREAHPDTAVTLRYARGASPISFSSGKAPPSAQSLTTTSTTAGPSTPRQLWPEPACSRTGTRSAS